MRRACSLLICLLAAPGVRAAPTLDEALAEDASLHGVAFVDPERGWAVGDRGVVLRTEDGGARWRRVATPTAARLDGVFFLDADHGWAVGGATRPYTHESVGVVLATENGGRDWSVVSTGSLPRLRAVRFFDRQNGVAVGDGTAWRPSGVFTTDDGGQHWRPVPGAEERRWLAGAFTRDRLGDLVGAVAGLRGASARITGRRVDASPAADDRRGAHGVALVDAARGWLVGDGGLVRVTDDGGQVWTPPPSDPPEQLAAWFDWRTVAAQGERVWIAGAPGSIVLSSTDGGATWGAVETGVTTPITAITFADDRHGWAVGELGVVLATRDGGQTWRVQRGGGRRAAAAVVVARPGELPTELIAANAASEGYRTVVAAPLAPETEAEAGPLTTRLVDAATRAGAGATRIGWAAPLDAVDADLPADVLRERLDRLTDDRTRELLRRELVKLLVTYRPEVLVVPRSTGAAELLAEAAVDAFDAAEPLPAGVRPWKPRRVVAVRADDGSPLAPGEARQSTGDFSAALGATPSQWAREARGLLTTDYTTAPAAYRWVTLAGEAPPVGSRPGLFDGLALTRGGDARREAAAASVDQLDQARRLAGKRRNLERLLQQAAGDPAWAGQVVNLTGGLDASAGAELLRQLAEGYRQAGRLELAANTLYLLARRYPDAPLADAALLWLVRYYGSGERAHADAHGQGVDARPATLANVPSTPAAALGAPEQVGVLSTEQRLERAGALVNFLQQARPELFAQPGFRFSQAAIQRARGFGADADKTALVLSKQAIADDWRRAAEAERWLAKPEGLPPEKPLAYCRYTPRRPKLDGRFDDPAWEGAEPMHLAEAAQSRPGATVRVARDDEFLFVAIEALAADATPVDKSVARPRDADLAEQDRVRLRIDVDRDYATAYELTVDARGWTHDALWGDSHWRPTWYVAADTSDGAWRAEVAVPLAELTDPDHAPRAAWAVSLERFTPGQAPTRWPASRAPADSPDAYGLLLLE